MKLYEVPNGTKILLDGEEFMFYNIDGMYSYCLNKDKQPVHIVAWADVEVVTKEIDGT